MNQKTMERVALTGLRIALAAAFLSSVIGRLGLLPGWGGGWTKFVAYCGSVNWYLPQDLVPTVAVIATVLETGFGLALLFGARVREAALGSAALLMLFALAMFSGDPKSPFDYSVFTASFAALTLSACGSRV